MLATCRKMFEEVTVFIQQRLKMAAADMVISRIFSMMDRDGSGSISQTELNACFQLFDNDGTLYVARGTEFFQHFLHFRH